MEYYRKTKREAEDDLAKLLKDSRVLSGKISREPHNGWVIILTPKPQDLTDLTLVAEVRGQRRHPSIKPRRASTTETTITGKPKTGVSKIVWDIAEQLQQRKLVIAEAVKQGVKENTAATQYHRWKQHKKEQ